MQTPCNDRLASALKSAPATADGIEYVLAPITIRRPLASWRFSAPLVVLALALLLALWPGGARAAGSPNIGLTTSVPATTLFGTQTAVRLVANNPVGEPGGYNVSFRVVLPAGVSYVSASTGTPAGEPTESPAAALERAGLR